MKTKIWTIVAVIAVILVIVVINKDTKPASGEAIKVGVLLSTTGIAAEHGENEVQGIKLAIKEINADGGVNGRPIEAIYEDDGTDPKNTVSALQKLLTIDKVEVVVGGTWDFLVNAALPVVESQKKVLITASALPDTLERQSPYIFVTHSPVAVNQPAFEKFLSQFQGKKIAVISVNNLWGKAYANAFKKAISNSGNTLVHEVVLPQFDNNDIQTELTLLKQKQPDAILVAANFTDAVTFSKRRVELGLNVPVLAEQKFMTLFEKGQLSAELFTDVTMFRFAEPNNDFIARFKKEYNETPGQYADTAYDAVYAIKLAIENQDGKTDAESIRAGLKQIKDYKGASGEIDFTINNYPTNKLPVLGVLQGGQFVQIK